MRVLLAFDREYPLYIEAIAEAIRTFRSNVEVAVTEAGNLEAEVDRLAPQLAISTSHISSNPVDPKLVSSLELSLEPEQTSKFRAGEPHWESTHLTLAQILSLVDETTWLYRTSPEQGDSMADNNKANIAVPDLKLELVPVPVSDVDRAKAFYEKAGFELTFDTQPTDTMRVVQLTPPGSACSILMETGMPGISDMQPGSVKGLHLVVADIDKAREALVKRELEVSEITDFSSVKYADFSDPDGSSWLLQEFPPELRQPGQSFYRQEE